MSIEKIKKNKKKIKIVFSLKNLRKAHELTIEQLSMFININTETIINYERKKNIIPPLHNLIKISNFYLISLDFLLLWDNTNYVKTIKLINLAKKLDDYYQPQERTHIEVTAKSFLSQKDNIFPDIITKQDNINIDLTNSINKNIELLKEKKDVSQKKIADFLNVNQSQVSHYQNKSIPPVDKLIKLSEYFNISIHALATGEKLYFDFQDRHFGKTMLLADRFLSLEHQQFLIELMENIVKKK